MGAIKKPTASMLLNPVHAISMGFGSGLSPFAPGTAGTLAAIPLYILAAHTIPWSLSEPQSFIVLILAMIILGSVCAHYTGKALGVVDHGAIVWDEVVGYFITMAVMPYAAMSWIEVAAWCLFGFFVFRFFDIFKPWPASWVDKHVKNGFGVVLDDAIAGVFSAVVVYFAIKIFGG